MSNIAMNNRRKLLAASAATAQGGAAAPGSLVQADTRYREPLVKASGRTLQ
jgi:hypothetical protein